MLNTKFRYLVVYLFLVFFGSQASAQGGHLKGRHIHTSCPACQEIVDEYNKLVDDMANLDQELSDVRKSIEVDNQFIKKDFERISSIESMPPSPKKAQELATANKVLDNDEKDLRNHRHDEENILKQLTKMITKKYDLLEDLDACEEDNCNPYKQYYQYFNHNIFYQQYEYYYKVMWQLMEIQIGLMGGYMPIYRTAHVTDFDENFRESNTTGSGGAGLQGKFIFGQANKVKPTITVNAETRFNSSNTVFNQAGSTVQLSNDWIARGLIGLESPSFFNNNFTAGVGAGIAVFDQSLKANIGGTAFSKNSTSVGPSLTLNLTYNACANCLFHQPLSISAQVFADQYSSINAQQGFMKASVDQKWQFSENLVFAIDFNKN